MNPYLDANGAVREPPSPAFFDHREYGDIGTGKDTGRFANRPYDTAFCA